MAKWQCESGGRGKPLPGPGRVRPPTPPKNQPRWTAALLNQRLHWSDDDATLERVRSSDPTTEPGKE